MKFFYVVMLGVGMAWGQGVATGIGPHKQPFTIDLTNDQAQWNNSIEVNGAGIIVFTSDGRILVRAAGREFVVPLHCDVESKSGTWANCKWTDGNVSGPLTYGELKPNTTFEISHHCHDQICNIKGNDELEDVPAVQEGKRVCETIKSNCGDSFCMNGDTYPPGTKICVGAYWTCADKDRVLLTSESGKHWCHKPNLGGGKWARRLLCALLVRGKPGRERIGDEELLELA